MLLIISVSSCVFLLIRSESHDMALFQTQERKLPADPSI